mmetsp:Transcript_27033/g.48553  ORF Transcript_27033/g.48553 Transcript_27033/m.48553 type:complete len:96 (-) Transcript_27033:31-318(-)
MAGLSPEQLNRLKELSDDFVANKNEASGTEAFTLVDLDHDGFATLAELSIILSQIRGHELSEEDVSRLSTKFAEHDTNSDGKLNLEEFLNFFRQQ